MFETAMIMSKRAFYNGNGEGNAIFLVPSVIAY